jgi:hypothetical protein
MQLLPSVVLRLKRRRRSRRERSRKGRKEVMSLQPSKQVHESLSLFGNSTECEGG